MSRENMKELALDIARISSGEQGADEDEVEEGRDRRIRFIA
jgi:hypothetical protein